MARMGSGRFWAPKYLFARDRYLSSRKPPTPVLIYTGSPICCDDDGRDDAVDSSHYVSGAHTLRPKRRKPKHVFLSHKYGIIVFY